MDRELKLFLEERELYRKVMQYIWQFNNHLIPEDVTNLRCAFRWSKTPEGHVFWDTLHLEWLEN